MIEAITAVARADAVALAVLSGGNARRTIDARTKRLRWLDALRIANGEPLPIDDEERDEAVLEGNRQRIRAALATIAELDGLGEPAGEEAPAEECEPVSADAVARLMLARRDVSLDAQAHLGAASVRQLLV